MAESSGDMNSENKAKEEVSSAESKPSLTNLTHKLKAEALRRLKLDDRPGSAHNSDGEVFVAEGLTAKPKAQEFEQLETKEGSQQNAYASSVSEIVSRAQKEDSLTIQQENNSDQIEGITNTLDNSESKSGILAEENVIKSYVEQEGELVHDDNTATYITNKGNSGSQKMTSEGKSHEMSVSNYDIKPEDSGEDAVATYDIKGVGPSLISDIVFDKPNDDIANAERESSAQSEEYRGIENKNNKSSSIQKLNLLEIQVGHEASFDADIINSMSNRGDTNLDNNKQFIGQSESNSRQVIGQANPFPQVQLHDTDPKIETSNPSPVHMDTQCSTGNDNASMTDQNEGAHTSTECPEKNSESTGLQSNENNGESKPNNLASSMGNKVIQDLTGTKPETTTNHGLKSPDADSAIGSSKLGKNELKKDNEDKTLQYKNVITTNADVELQDKENDNVQMSEKEFCSSESQAIGDMSGNKQGSTESTLGKKTSNENDIGDVNLSKAEKEYIGSQVEGERCSTHDNEHDADEKSKREETGDVKIVTVEEHMVPEESADHGLSPGDEENTDDTALANDFYYERATSLFNPSLTEGVPHDFLSLYHSFGYECTKRENLHILDINIVVFSAGNLIQILNLQTMEQSYIGGTNNGGIGAITVHPSRQYIAVAEKGVKPSINIYEYPSLKLFRILREGTQEAYAHLNFSPSGTKLASLGSSPDFMLTVWDWKNEKVILRSKAFSQDVYKVAFSPENEGHLCTSGSGHIRFWTMANTFTGLKLQGELGRFGTTELTDIEGFVELPDGKVLSGSEWGNMLLWDGGLIKVEICKKGKKLCHNGMIEQFFMDEGELMTIGADGYIKVWDFESIDNADISDEKNRVFEMEPMYEIKVGADVKLKSMVKSVNPNTPTIWFGQDASGALWKLDLSFTHTSHAPEKLFSFHAGSITCVEASPVSHLVATCGLDCTVRLYDYLNKLPLCTGKYSSSATSLLWLPKIIDPKCTSLLSGFLDGVVRYLSIAKDDASTSRTKGNKLNVEFQLLQVFKPHTKSVTSMVLDKHGKILATGSEDCTVFFFTIEDTCKPVGFIETASQVVSMSWLDNAPDERLLVFCKDGAVLDVEVPLVGTLNTDKSFRVPLQDLVKREYMFARVKDKLLKVEEDERKAQIKEEKQRRKEEERKRRRARGSVEEEEIEEEEDDDDEEEETNEQEEEQIDHGPSVAIRGFPSISLDKFWMLMDGWDAGYIYECEFPAELSEGSSIAKEPVNAIKLLNCDDAPVRSYTYSNSGNFVLFGMENGVVRIHPVRGKNVLDSLTTYWVLPVHDSHQGAITAIRTSFDDKYVFTVGADGNFFVYNFLSEATLKESKSLSQSFIPKIKTVVGEDGQEVPKTIEDIDDPNYYSIELEKQKAEHDRMIKIAEEKKQNVRRRIARLRRSFKSIFERNQNLPDYLRIRPQELEIDPELRKQHETQTAEKIDLVRKVLAWESEKHAIGFRKLQDRFKSMLDCDRIILYACTSSHKVASFRSAKVSELHESLKESLDSSAKAKDVISGKELKKGNMSGAKGMLPGKRKLTQADLRKKSLQVTSGEQLDGKVAKALEKAEQRRMKRELRQAEWDELYQGKPDENYQDPKDLSAIKEAKDNMGDYKLKTAKDYVVPEGRRVNADIKLMQLLQLLDQIHYYKTNFNQRLLSLRDKKISVIKEVNDCVNNLKYVQSKLDPAFHKPLPTVPEMKPEELPERNVTYNKKMLYSFRKQQENKKDKTDDGSGRGGFGGFGVAEAKPPQSAAGSRDRTFSSVSVLSGSRPKSSQSVKTSDNLTSEAIMEDARETPTELEIQLKTKEQIRMNYEQDRLLKRIHFLLTNFDGELKTLRHEKSQREVTLKNAELRHVTLFEELVLLKEFEKRENTFANRVKTKGNEKQDMLEKIEACQVKLDIKKEEIEKYQEQEKSLYATFSSMIGENNKFDGFLTKVFRKKIKRAKKKEEAKEGSEEESGEDDSDEELSSSEESNSDEETLDDSVCPPGCDQSLFDHVCQLRESRLDIEENLTEEKKALESMKKELEALKKKAKVIDSALSTAEFELEAFQREKQQKLNELDVVVTVKLHQIQNVVNNAMSQDLTSCLVFLSSDQNRLQKRIKELEVEKAQQKTLFREHRQMHVQLKKDKKAKEAEIYELEEKVKSMQMLKFGRLVDFERLENVSVNRSAEELKERLRHQESQNARELAKWDKKIQAYQEKLTQRTRENTDRLNASTILFYEREELEQKLDSRQKSLGAEYSGNRKSDVKERHRLVQLVQLQAQEIDSLKDEITLLSRKGGHILPPSQPPLPASQTAIPNI